MAGLRQEGPHAGRGAIARRTRRPRNDALCGLRRDHDTWRPLVDKRIRDAVDRELVAKGYRRVQDRSPDFYVAFYLSVEDKMDVYTVNRGYYDYWGYGVSIPETRVRQYEEGTW